MSTHASLTLPMLGRATRGASLPTAKLKALVSARAEACGAQQTTRCIHSSVIRPSANRDDLSNFSSASLLPHRRLNLPARCR